MIEISNLSVSVKDRVLLNGISAVMEDGKIYALLGENGSGKSTFIRALTSYFPDYSGSIAFDGRELKTFRQKEREKLHSLLPQMLPHFDLSVSSFLSMYPDGKKELSKLGLGYLLEERMNTLSGGEKEMVFLAFALSRSAQLYALEKAIQTVFGNDIPQQLINKIIQMIAGEVRPSLNPTFLIRQPNVLELFLKISLKSNNLLETVQFIDQLCLFSASNCQACHVASVSTHCHINIVCGCGTKIHFSIFADRRAADPTKSGTLFTDYEQHHCSVHPLAGIFNSSLQKIDSC